MFFVALTVYVFLLLGFDKMFSTCKIGGVRGGLNTKLRKINLYV